MPRIGRQWLAIGACLLVVVLIMSSAGAAYAAFRGSLSVSAKPPSAPQRIQNSFNLGDAVAGANFVLPSPPCPAGTTVTAGGGAITSSPQGINAFAMTGSAPAEDNNFWAVSWHALTPAQGIVASVFAYCQ